MNEQIGQNSFVPEVIFPDNTTLPPARISPVDQTVPYHTVSQRYRQITTADVVSALRDGGWVVVDYKTARVRNPDKMGFQKHFVTMRSAGGTVEVGDCEFRVLMVNSHDGTSTFQLFMSLFRKLCMNGLHISLGQFMAIRIRHSVNDIRDQAIAGAGRLLSLAPDLNNTVQQMRSRILLPSEQQDFGTRVVNLIWPDRSVSTAYVQPSDILQVRRPQDNTNDLWTVYQRAQEAVIRGSLPTANGRSTRMVKSPTRDLDLNIKLFGLANEFLAR